MPNPLDTTPSDDKWFHQNVPHPFETNRRKSTRYIRNDIGVTIRKIGMLTFFKKIDIPVKLVDISSRGVGVLIATSLRLTINKKVILVVRFADFKEFEIPGTVIRKSLGEIHVYGIKFLSVNNELANYLLKTQTKLTFK